MPEQNHISQKALAKSLEASISQTWKPGCDPKHRIIPTSPAFRAASAPAFLAEADLKKSWAGPTLDGPRCLQGDKAKHNRLKQGRCFVFKCLIWELVCPKVFVKVLEGPVSCLYIHGFESLWFVLHSGLQTSWATGSAASQIQILQVRDLAFHKSKYEQTTEKLCTQRFRSFSSFSKCFIDHGLSGAFRSRHRPGHGIETVAVWGTKDALGIGLSKICWSHNQTW